MLLYSNSIVFNKLYPADFSVYIANLYSVLFKYLHNVTENIKNTQTYNNVT